MSISQVLVILLRRGWIVVLALLTTMIVAGGVLLFVPGRYDAVATASIDPGNVDPISETSRRRRDDRADARQHLSLVTSQRVAVDVVKRLNLTANPQVQESFRKSGSFGRESIEEWMASSLVRNVDPKFIDGDERPGDQIQVERPEPGGADRERVSRVDDRRLGGDEGRRRRPDCALVCAADRGIAQGCGDRARGACRPSRPRQTWWRRTTAGIARPASTWRSAQQLSAARAEVNTLQSRLASGSTDLSNDPSDPDLQILAGLKEKLSTSQSAIEAAKGVHRPQQSEDGGRTGKSRLDSQAARRRDGEDAAASERAHRDDAGPDRRPHEPSRRRRKKRLIAVQGQRSRLDELQHDVVFRSEQLNAREKERRKSKAEEQADVFGYDRPRQGGAASRAGVSETADGDSDRNRRRPRARPVACAARGGDRSPGPLSDRSRIFGVRPVLGQS